MTSKEALCEIKRILEEELNSTLDAERLAEPLESALEALDIIKERKLLNYVLKNEKCAKMYNLSKSNIDKLKRIMEGE